MKRFRHVDAATVDDAVALLRRHGPAARLNAGGTDLLGLLKDDLMTDFPELIVNLKTIPGLAGIEAGADGGLTVGALTILSRVAGEPRIKADYPALAEAARRTASPLLRNLGTLGGNICQENRCWYYRYPHKLGGRLNCVRKGGAKCLAAVGDHRYHSIFGAVNKCLAVSPGDTAPALVALEARIVTTTREIAAENFFSGRHGRSGTVLEPDEVVLSVALPPPAPGGRSAFRKAAFRKSIDFALANCAVGLVLDGRTIRSARVVLGGVAAVPRRAAEAEAVLAGGTAGPELFARAAEAALAPARPLPKNAFKVALARALVADALADCLAG